MKGESLNIVEEKKVILQNAFPEVFTEGKIDWEKLKITLGEELVFTNERYVLNWAGKSEAFKVLQTPTTATLVPDKSESVNFDTTENLFIEGENLEVLKVLQKSYYGRIKMIYIDPPYNTGNDSFIYPDRFAESKEDYLKRIGDKDEEGYLLKEGLFRKNSKDSGHYHSNWLSMMYPRLFLARNLLSEDGLIFVSIDDNEVHNLRMLMNEIFGEENFIDCMIWKKRYGGGAKEKYLVSVHEYILFYAKNLSAISHIFVPLDEESIKRYYTLKDDNFEKRGPYRTHPLEATRSVGRRENLVFVIPAPDGTQIMPERQWWWDKKRAFDALDKGELEFIKDRNGKWAVHTKQYLKDDLGKQRKTKAFSLIDDIYTQHGTKEIETIFGDSRIFTFPKPSKLIYQLMQIAGLEDGDIALDFFAGSNATGHALIDYNETQGTNCSFIAVQLAEKLEQDSEAFKQGYKTVADIGKARLKKFIELKRTKQKSKPEMFNTNLEQGGFKVFKLKPSNFKIWRTDIESPEELAKQLDAFVEPTKTGTLEENMLYELLLKTGRDLNSTVEKLIRDSADYYSVNGGEMVVVLSKITGSLIQEIIGKVPQKVLTLDKLFEGNDQLKTNTVLQMKDAGIDFRTI